MSELKEVKRDIKDINKILESLTDAHFAIGTVKRGGDDMFMITKDGSISKLLEVMLEAARRDSAIFSFLNVARLAMINDDIVHVLNEIRETSGNLVADMATEMSQLRNGGFSEEEKKQADELVVRLRRVLEKSAKK